MRMARRKQTDNQLSFGDYQLKQVDVRLKLMDGPSYYSQTPLQNPADAAMVMRDVLKALDREWVCVVNMDNHLKPVNFNVVSIGSINASLAPVQNILKSAMLSNCNNMMLLHNHPSGETEPSREDMQLTKRVSEAAKLMDMSVIDHLIVGGQNGDLYSIREHDPELFTGTEVDFDYIHHMEKAADRGLAENGMAHTKNGEPGPAQAGDSGLAEGKAFYQAKEKYDPKQAAENRKNEMKETTEKLEQGVADLFNREKYQTFLNTMAKFPRYSYNNNLLIMLQKPDATLCQSYTGWKEMGRFVKRGEKGIRILAPTPFKIDREQNKVDEKGRTILDKDGEPVKETVQIDMTAQRARDDGGQTRSSKEVEAESVAYTV